MRKRRRISSRDSGDSSDGAYSASLGHVLLAQKERNVFTDLDIVVQNQSGDKVVARVHACVVAACSPLTTQKIEPGGALRFNIDAGIQCDDDLLKTYGAPSYAQYLTMKEKGALKTLEP